MDFEIRFLANLLKLVLITGSLLMGANGVEIGTGDGNGEGGDGFFPATQNIIVSVAVLCTIVLAVVGCTWASWRRILCFWRKQGTHEAPPDWFIPGSAMSPEQHSRSFSTLDPANLPNDTRGGRASISIEPLPSLDNLGLDGRDSFELRTFRTPGIVPSPSSSTSGLGNVEDWLQEPEGNFPRQHLEYQKIVGKGWFGKVLEAEASNIKQYVRVSNVIVRDLRDNATEEEQLQFLNEARLYKEANRQGSGSSENVLKMLGYCVETMPYILIFEYYPLGDLKSYLKSRAKQAPGALRPGDDGVLSRMIIDIIRGLKWMIQAGFVHGDLSTRNCLVATSAGKVIIGDYGFSTQKYRADYYWTSNRAIPIRWAAPETLSLDDEYFPPSAQVLEITHEANIWSLAVVIWEVFQLGKLPYDTLTDEEVIRKVIRQGYLLEPPQLPFVNENTKDKIYQLLVSCWNSSPSLRPRIETIEQVFTTPS